MKINIKTIFNLSALAVIIIYIVFGIMIPFVSKKDTAVVNDIVYFSGEGTQESPYLISNALHLLQLSKLVNSGNEFRSAYFEQTQDINMDVVDQFIPIGEFNLNHYFYGVYNGAGHTISNLMIDGDEARSRNVALFGQLGGIVKNLGIESGLIEGAYIGSIASHAVGEEAMIINCYNKATLRAKGRAGGIADNFGRGKIVNCWNEGNLEAPETGGICSYSANTLYNSYCIQEKFINDHYNGSVKYAGGGFEQSKDNLMLIMNNGVQLAVSSFRLQENSLTEWTADGEKISFKRSETASQ